MMALHIRGPIKEITVTRKDPEIKDDENNDRGILADVMPNFVEHAGQWRGKHLHFSTNGCLLETHCVFLNHVFPNRGKFAHLQTNQFYCGDGRKQELFQKSILRGNSLRWNNSKFEGCIWESDFGIILLNMHQIEYPNVCLNEIICLEPDTKHRSSTRQWFREGKLIKRTICDEIKLKQMANPATGQELI